MRNRHNPVLAPGSQVVGEETVQGGWIFYLTPPHLGLVWGQPLWELVRRLLPWPPTEVGPRQPLGR